MTARSRADIELRHMAGITRPLHLRTAARRRRCAFIALAWWCFAVLIGFGLIGIAIASIVLATSTQP